MKQLALKLLANGEYTQEQFDSAMQITGGDNYTKFVCDVLKNSYDSIEYGRRAYDLIRGYNKDLFPIKDFSIVENGYYIFLVLKHRERVVNMWNLIPSIAKRNIKDNRVERDLRGMEVYSNLISYLYSNMSLLTNRDEDIAKKIMMKAFSSNYNTINDILDFFEDKENLIGGIDMDAKYIRDLVDSTNSRIVYQKGDDVIVVAVYSYEAMRKIGCTSLWCFSYPHNQNEWYKYSPQDMVYVIFINSEARYVLWDKLERTDRYYIDYGESPLYDVTNQTIDDPHRTLKGILGSKYKSIFDWDE